MQPGLISFKPSFQGPGGLGVVYELGVGFTVPHVTGLIDDPACFLIGLHAVGAIISRLHVEPVYKGTGYTGDALMEDRAGRRGSRRNRIYRGRLNGGQGRKEGGRRNMIYRGRLNGGQGRKEGGQEEQDI